jgi:hypothetical protein
LPPNDQFIHRSIADGLEEEAELRHTIFGLEWLGNGSRIWLLQITGVYGLILLPASTKDYGTFRRIGVCHFASNVKIKTISSIKVI